MTAPEAADDPGDLAQELPVALMQRAPYVQDIHRGESFEFNLLLSHP